jgi:hypothetical protein
MRAPRWANGFVPLSTPEGFSGGQLLRVLSLLPSRFSGSFVVGSGSYQLLGVAVGDGVAAGAGAGVKFHMSSRFFQIPPSRR